MYELKNDSFTTHLCRLEHNGSAKWKNAWSPAILVFFLIFEFVCAHMILKINEKTVTTKQQLFFLLQAEMVNCH